MEVDQGDEAAWELSHYKPDAWLGKHWWDETQNVPIPSARAKRSADYLVWAEHVKNGVGWLLLAQFGILTLLLKTLPDDLYWLAWAIFLLEAVLKVGRTRAKDHFFRGVPCAFLALNQETALRSLTFFGRACTLSAVAELGLYVPYLLIAASRVHDFYDDDEFAQRGAFADPADPYSRARMTEMIVLSCVVVCVHWAASLGNLGAFVYAMGIKCMLFPIEKIPRKGQSAGKGGGKGRSQQTTEQLDRLLSLTWWLHLVRHPFLSASVASAQLGRCGLQGQWFESVESLKKILEDSMVQTKSVNTPGLWVSQDMAMRALSSVSKHGTIDSCRTILDENGLLLLILIVEEGNPFYCRGLAASTIGTLVNRGCFDGEELANLSDAIPALQKLVRSESSELQEMAIGALLNIALNTSQQEEAVDEMLASPDQSVPEDGVSSRFFVESLLMTAHKGSTMRCRVLASGLLACMVGNKKVRDAVLGSQDHDYVGMFSRALRSGATLEVKRSAAGLIWELALWDPEAVGSGVRGDRCIRALVGALRETGEPSVAAAAAGALASLAMASDHFKEKILEVEGCVEALIEQLRGKLMWRLSNHLLELYGIVYNKVQEQAQAQAARVIWTLAADNQKNQDIIARKGAIPEIVKLLTVRNPYVQMQAAAALDALAHKNKSIQDLIGLYYREAFTGLAELLNPARPDIPENLLETVLEKAALAVRSLAEGHTPNAEKLLGSGATDRLTAILERDKQIKFDNSKVCDVVIEALASTGGASRSSSTSARKSSSVGLSMSGPQLLPSPTEYSQVQFISQDLNINSYSYRFD